MTDTQLPKSRKPFLLQFNAVDLVTIAVLAVLLRFVFLYVYKALYVVFPWNQALFPLFMSFTLAVLMKMVPKHGAVFLWSVVWGLINIFLQGEVPLYAAGVLIAPVLAEVVIWAMTKGGALIDSFATILLAGTVYTLAIKIWDWYALNEIFLIPYTFGMLLIVVAISVIVANPLGVYGGAALGSKVRKLLG
jgi:hypothetical protein